MILGERRSLLLLLALLGGASGGCSLILDPEECTSDSDCAPGTCNADGICIGDEEAPDGAPDGADGGGGAADMGPPDREDGDVPPPDGMPPDDAVVPPPDMDTPDVAPPDMGPPDAGPPVGPECLFVAPSENDRLTSQAETGVSIQIIDRDTPRDQLVVTLNDVPVALDENGGYTLNAQLREGENEFTVVATDERGVSCDKTITVVSDQTPPTIQREQPLGDCVRVSEEQAMVRACVDDPHDIGILQAELRAIDVPDADMSREGNCLMACAGVCLEFPVELVQGRNEVIIRAFDDLGNGPTEDTFCFELDTVAPEIEVFEPESGIVTAEGTVPLRGEVRDPQGDVSQIDIEVHVTGPRAGQRRGPIEPQVDPQNGGFAIAALELYNGLNLIEACAFDIAQNYDCVTVRVTSEQEDPCIDILTPIDEAIVASGEVEVTGTACEGVVSVALFVAANRFEADLRDDLTWSGSVNLPNPGQYTIRAVATTLGGRTSEDEVHVAIDDTPPVVTITEPVDGACLRGEPTFRVCGRAFDVESGITTLDINGRNAFATLRMNGDYCFDLALPEGDGEVTVTATNRARQAADAEVEVEVDRTPPSILFDFADGAFVAADEVGRVSLRGRLSDEGCGIVGGAALELNGARVLVLGDGTFNARAELAAGPHTVTFVATDAVGNSVSVMRDVVVDGTPPTVEVTAPRAGTATTAGTIRVSARVADAESGLGTVVIGTQAQIDADEADEVQAVGGVASADVELVEGSNLILVRAFDRVGLVGTGSVEVVRDRVEPIVVVESPQEGDAVESLAVICGTAEDPGSGIDTVDVNGTEAEVDAEGNWCAAGIALEGGANVISVFATDRAGNESVAIEINVRVLDFAPTAPARVNLVEATAIGWIGTADLNADGRLDIIALSGADDGLSGTFLQQADGTFDGRDAAASGLRADGNAITAAALGDFNRDGRPDVAIGYADGAELRLGRADGTFERSGAPGSPDDIEVLDLAAGDFNRDGNLDLLLLAGLDSLLMNGTGGGGFIDGDDLPGGDVPSDRGLERASDATRVLVHDFTGDRVQDVVLVGDDFSVFYKSDRNGVFTAADEAASGFESLAGGRMLPVDADRDGDLDLLVAGDEPRFHLYAGADTWTVGNRGITPAGATPWAAAADFDGDARDDVVVGGAEGLEHWEATAMGFALQDAEVTGMLEAAVTGPMQAVDIDGDTDFDLLVTTADGLRLVRSNRSVGGQYRYVRLTIRRGRAGQEGPTDSVGITVTADLDDNFSPDRAVAAPAFGPTVVTLGAAEAANLVVHFTDKGGAGSDRRNLEGRASGTNEAVNAPE